jgi:hypothetical protein
MLEGLFRVHMGRFRYGGTSNDPPKSLDRDSPSQKTALSSSSSNEGSRKKCLSSGLQSEPSLSA